MTTTSKFPSRTQRTWSATFAALLTAMLLAATTSSAHAVSNPGVTTEGVNTDVCPCAAGGGALDPVHFKYDGGTYITRGHGVVIGLFTHGKPKWYAHRLFQIEFHPRGEILKIKDFKADNDAVYVTLTDRNTGITHGPYRVPSGKRSQSFNLGFKEGTPLKLKVYDRWSTFDDGLDLLTSYGVLA